MTTYIDAHCHLDAFADPARILDGAPNTVVVAVTDLPSRFRLLSTRFRGDPRVRVALGLHPLRAATGGPLEEGQLIRQLDNAEYIGEVGLDFSRHGRDTRDTQLRVFDRLLAQPAVRNKVVTVHSRGAEATVIERLRDAGVRAILHWYTGPTRLVETALDAGMYFSINPAMLSTNTGCQTIAMLPADRILTESDGPFAKLRGRVAGPGDIWWLVTELAKRWRTDPADAQHVIYGNLATLYGNTVMRSQDR
jgi:TatD DNase family protein